MTRSFRETTIMTRSSNDSEYDEEDPFAESQDYFLTDAKSRGPLFKILTAPPQAPDGGSGRACVLAVPN